MDANLMQAVGQGLALQEGEPVESFPNLEDGQRTFAVLRVDAHEAEPQGVRRHFGVHGEPVLRGGAPARARHA